MVLSEKFGSMELNELDGSSLKPRCLLRKLEVPLPLGLTHRITLRLLCLAEDVFGACFGGVVYIARAIYIEPLEL